MNNQLNHIIAQQRIDDYRREAAQARLASETRSGGSRARPRVRLLTLAKRRLALPA